MRPPRSVLAVGACYGANAAVHRVSNISGLPLLTEPIEIRSPGANVALFAVSEHDDTGELGIIVQLTAVSTPFLRTVNVIEPITMLDWALT